MKKLLPLVGALLCLSPSDAAAAGARPAIEPVALVYSLVGEATRSMPPGNRWRRPLRLFERLSAGTTLEVRPGSHLALAFANGHRYELGERSQATLGSDDLAARSGSVRPLPVVPPLPCLASIAKEERPGWRSGALRLRGQQIARLYPHDGTATLAGATVLRFEPVGGFAKYRIEVQDREGAEIFATETTNSVVDLPPGVLQPGVSYTWMVRTQLGARGRPGPVLKSTQGFVALPTQLAEAREALRSFIETTGDATSLALLAEVDRSLGLRFEAREEFQAAVRIAPEQAGLAEALASLERDLPVLPPIPWEGKPRPMVGVREPASLGTDQIKLEGRCRSIS